MPDTQEVFSRGWLSLNCMNREVLCLDKDTQRSQAGWGSHAPWPPLPALHAPHQELEGRAPFHGVPIMV